MLRRLVAAGMDVARLNFSHGTPAEHQEALSHIRAIASEVGRPVAVLQDLAGPKIRVGSIAEGAVDLVSGNTFTLTRRSVPGDASEISVSYDGLAGDVQPGDSLLLSDGALELVVEKTTEDDVVCRVVVGGPLAPRKGINLPSRSVSIPFPTPKDVKDLAFGLQKGVDYVALSFVRTAADVEGVRRLVRESGDEVPLIAKIEKHEALEHIDEILAAVDGIMVARGDLGVEIPVEQVPRIQKMLIDKANFVAKPVITATQMLRSMVESPRPTRAEVTDVANAILDGTDAVMLSEETAQGRYPVEAVQVMDRVARDVEGSPGLRIPPPAGERPSPLGAEEAVAEAASKLAAAVGATAVITCTKSGSTTRLVARHRPRTPVLGVTPDERTYRALALVWGAVPLNMAPADSAEDMERQAMRSAVAAGLVRPGDRVVITAGLPLHVPGTTNAIKVASVE